MENKKQLGGKRKGAGRKPVLNKKKQISLYVEGNKVIKFGSEEKMKEHLYTIIDNFGDKEIFFSTPIPESYDGKKMDKITHDEPAMWQESKPLISPNTGLPPKVSLFDDFMEQLKNANTVHQVESVMKKAKGEIFTPRDKMALEAYAKEISKDMFND